MLYRYCEIFFIASTGLYDRGNKPTTNNKVVNIRGLVISQVFTEKGGNYTFNSLFKNMTDLKQNLKKNI